MTRCKTLLLVASATILAGTPLIASAQQTQPRRPRSTMRIPIGKDRALRAGRTDTTVIARTDTVRLPGRVDTVTVNRSVTDTVTVTRVDTVLQEPSVGRVGGFYAGIGGGALMADPDFSFSDKPGWHVEVPIGYDPVGSAVGLRVALGYGQNAPQDWVAGIGNAQHMSADGDLKFRLVTLAPGGKHAQIYGLGGVSWVRFRDIAERNAAGGWSVGSTNPGSNTPAADSTWYSGMGWNTGAGFQIGSGRTNFFAEARFVRFKGVYSNVSYTPILVGFTWY